MTTTQFQELILQDIRAIFSLSEGGRPARYAPEAGPTVETTVIREDEIGLEAGAFGENDANTVGLHVMTAAVPNPKYGETIVLTDTEETFMVIKPARRSFGRILLLCVCNERMVVG